MAYCPNCAAVLDPSQKFCSRCGQASAAAPSPSLQQQRPSSVKIAVALLLITCPISLISTAIFLFAHPPAASPLFLTRSIGLTILMILLTIGVWQRQSWARIAIVLLIVWGSGNLVVSMIRLSGSPTAIIALALPLVIAGLRLGAIYLCFLPESNAWFKN